MDNDPAVNAPVTQVLPAPASTESHGGFIRNANSWPPPQT